MAPTFKVALIQLHPKPVDPLANFENARGYILKAAEQHCDLAVLPEYHLTSWVPAHPRFRLMCEQSAAYLEKYKELARECHICIVPGTMVECIKDETGQDVLLNVAYFIDNNGNLLGRYVKTNLWHPERTLLTAPPPSSNHAPISTPLGKVGLLVCWDLAFPEAFRELIVQGAKLVIVPTFWGLNDCSPAGLVRNPTAEKLFLQSTLVSRAFENTCGVIFVNAAGKDSCGLSQVAMPFIGSVGRIEGPQESMSIAEVDMQILEEAEDNYKVRQDMEREDWHYVYKHHRQPKL